MDDTGLPQIGDDLPELSALSTQDIPVAVREVDQLVSPARSFKPNFALWGLGSLAGIAAVAGAFWLLRQPAQTVAVSSTAPVAQAAIDSATEATTASPAASPPRLLGHLPYPEAPKADLRPISGYGAIRLHSAAAAKLEAMISAAAKEGVELVPLSGFRTVEEQNSLFFDVKAARGEVATTRAAVSAPPGYSEHHTGYAIDIGDGDAPSADLQFEFDQTEAYKWLQENAAFYSFELSFPKNNPMGVSYEPWHWRFVGDRQSLETFYKARTDTAARPATTTPESASQPQSASQSEPQPAQPK